MKIPENPNMSVWNLGNLARIRWFSAGLTVLTCSEIGEGGRNDNLGGNPVEPSERTSEQQVADDRNDEETGGTKKNRVRHEY
jgi:hypothetical protein